jgi:hypothetical protein
MHVTLASTKVTSASTVSSLMQVPCDRIGTALSGSKFIIWTKKSRLPSVPSIATHRNKITRCSVVEYLTPVRPLSRLGAEESATKFDAQTCCSHVIPQYLHKGIFDADQIATEEIEMSVEQIPAF